MKDVDIDRVKALTKSEWFEIQETTSSAGVFFTWAQTIAIARACHRAAKVH
jgi:hypothetical protein